VWRVAGGEERAVAVANDLNRPTPGATYNGKNGRQNFSL